MPKSCIPMTAKMKMIIHSTRVRLPRAPIVFPMMDIKRFNVGQDFASLKTRNCEITSCFVWKAINYHKKIIKNYRYGNHSGFNRLSFKPKIISSWPTHQPKRPQNWKALDPLETQLKEGEGDNEEVENVPAFLEVELRTHRKEFHEGFNTECSSEKLDTNTYY